MWLAFVRDSFQVQQGMLIIEDIDEFQLVRNIIAHVTMILRLYVKVLDVLGFEI